jgi:hypothetical protein
MKMATSYQHSVGNPLDTNTLPTPPPPPEWATYVSDRGPMFKMHNSFAHAKNAVTGKVYGNVATADIVIYRWTGDSWQVLESFTKGEVVFGHAFWDNTALWKMRKGLTQHVISE